MISINNVQILVWFLLMAFIANSSNYDKFILLYGETQTGKSSMVNAIFDEAVAKTGEDSQEDGDSVTTHPMVYSKLFKKSGEYGIPQDFILRIMDTPGNLDNRGILTDADILDNIVFALSKYNIKQIDVIFISESLSGDAKQLRRNLDKIRQIFGRWVMESIVVLGTKENEGYQTNGGRRSEAIKRQCDKFGVKYMTYESTKAYHHNEQLKKFMDMIFRGAVKPYAVEKVDEINKQIEERAQELMAETPKKVELIDVEHKVVKHRDVEKIEEYIDTEWGVVGKGEREFLGLFGRRKKIYGPIPVRKTRKVTVKEPYPDTEMRVEKVEIDHDPEKFIEMAREEFRKRLLLPVEFKQEL